jgi:hypothetical protein
VWRFNEKESASHLFEACLNMDVGFDELSSEVVLNFSSL